MDSDMKFLREIDRLGNPNTICCVSIDELSVGQNVLITDLNKYVENSSDWVKSYRGYYKKINNVKYNLLHRMMANSNKKMEITEIMNEDRVVMEDGFSYLLDMFEII